MARRTNIRVMAGAVLAPLLLASCAAAAPDPTVTPIEHLVVVVGENLSFDNLFATFRPQAGESVANLLSKGIVAADGSPGPDVALAAQLLAVPRQRYEVTPPTAGRFTRLPQPNTTYARGLPQFTGDRRFPRELPNAPFPITRYADYLAYVGDPVHRFFQMWQQVDGGKNDLFVWTAVSSGEGARKRDDASSGTNQGGVAMGFYNMAAGDAPYLRALAERYALADNYHQPIMGGTGANYFALATGEPDRESGAAARHQQLVHAVRLPRRLLCGLRRSAAARRQGDPRLSRRASVSRFQRRQLRAAALLSREQLPARLHADRRGEAARAERFHLAAADRADHRRGARRQGRVVDMVQRRSHGGRHRQGRVLRHLRCADAFERGDDRAAQAEPAPAGRARSRPRREIGKHTSELQS